MIDELGKYGKVRKTFCTMVKKIKLKKDIWAIIIIARSGAGKGTVTNALLALAEVNKQVRLKKSISDTTKFKKPNFVEGVDYNFISPDEFQKRKSAGYYLETDEYAGNFYGSPLHPYMENKAAGIITIFDVEANGAEALQAAIGENHCLIFRLDVPLDELHKRVKKRGRDTEEEQALRKVADAKRVEKMIRISIPIPYGANAVPDVTANTVYNYLFENAL